MISDETRDVISRAKQLYRETLQHDLEASMAFAVNEQRVNELSVHKVFGSKIQLSAAGGRLRGLAAVVPRRSPKGLLLIAGDPCGIAAGY